MASSAINNYSCCVGHGASRLGGALEIALGVSGSHHTKGENQHEDPNQIRFAAHLLTPFWPTAELLAKASARRGAILLSLLKHFQRFTVMLYNISTQQSRPVFYR